MLPHGSTPLELAKSLHSDIAEGFLYAIDAVSGLRLPKDYILRDRDVVSIVSTKKKTKSKVDKK
jgi:hypothetical protein